MVSELCILSDAVDPAIEPIRTHREPRKPFNLQKRLEGSLFGRFVLGCSRWLVVFALVLIGFYGAQAVNSGMKTVRHGSQTAPHILGASLQSNVSK